MRPRRVIYWLHRKHVARWRSYGFVPSPRERYKDFERRVSYYLRFKEMRCKK